MQPVSSVVSTRLPYAGPGCVEFPERFEELLRPFDDAVIAFLQKWLHPILIVVSRLFAGELTSGRFLIIRGVISSVVLALCFLSVIYSVEVAAMIPFLLVFVGWEREAMLAVCHLTVLLVITQLPKRVIWRYRPYMKSRAKTVCLKRFASVVLMSVRKFTSSVRLARTV